MGDHSTHEQLPPPRRDEILYVACSQSGLVPNPSDFVLAIDLRAQVEHRALGELHFDGAHEELHCVEWLRADHTSLLALDTGSSRIYVVDVATDPSAPALAAAVSAEEIDDATAYSRPLDAAALPGDRAVVALGAGGAHDFGGLAVFGRDGLRRLGDDADAPISALAVAADGDIVVGLRAASGAPGLLAWDAATGASLARCRLPVAARAVVASPREPGGFLACADGALLHWRIAGEEIVLESAGAMPGADLAPAARSVIGLTISRDASRLYVGDWHTGTLGSYSIGDAGRLTEIDTLILGGRLQTGGDAEGPRWDEMIRRGGRAALAGPANLTLAGGDGSLVVTNGAWVDAERAHYPTFCSWLLVVDCEEDGRMEVDVDRVMTIVNRPLGPARYGTARTSWRAAR